MSDVYVTISKEWTNTPSEKQSNATLSEDLTYDGTMSECLKVDSTNGRWTSIFCPLPTQQAGDTLKVIFWVKMKKNPRVFRVDVMHENWDEHVEYPLDVKQSCLIAKKGDYYLFSISHEIKENKSMCVAIQIDQAIVTLFPAKIEDLTKYSGQIDELSDLSNYRIIKCYEQTIPRCRFVGIRYAGKKRSGDVYKKLWNQWFRDGYYETLEKLITDEFRVAYPDFDAYVSLTKSNKDDPSVYEYWIGMFVPFETVIPEDCAFLDFDTQQVAVIWVKGEEWAVFGHEEECYQHCMENGMTVKKNADGSIYRLERYQCPRYTQPDENNEVILDFMYFI